MMDDTARAGMSSLRHLGLYGYLPAAHLVGEVTVKIMHAIWHNSHRSLAHLGALHHGRIFGVNRTPAARVGHM